jgi:uncharacterized protein (DUF2141 family)
MFKKLMFLCFLLCIFGNTFADNIQTKLQINNVVINGGALYVAVYSNENEHKNSQAFISFILEPVSNTLIHSLELPEGEYVVSIFQDTNNDGKLNNTIFWIPIEPVGITNYNHRGAPGNFNRLKTPVNSNSTTIIVNMGRVKPI